MSIVDELRAWPARGDGSDGMSSHTVGGIMEAAASAIEDLAGLLDAIRAEGGLSQRTREHVTTALKNAGFED